MQTIWQFYKHFVMITIIFRSRNFATKVEIRKINAKLSTLGYHPSLISNLGNPKNLLELSFLIESWCLLSSFFFYLTRRRDESETTFFLVKIPNLSNPEHTLETIYHLQDFDKIRKAFLSVSYLSIFHAQCPNCITLYLTGDRSEERLWSLSLPTQRAES